MKLDFFVDECIQEDFLNTDLLDEIFSIPGTETVISPNTDPLSQLEKVEAEIRELTESRKKLSLQLRELRKLAYRLLRKQRNLLRLKTACQ